MSKKHFQAFADAIARIDDPQERERVALLVAEVCQQFNCRFDRGRFLCACDVRE